MANTADLMQAYNKHHQERLALARARLRHHEVELLFQRAVTPYGGLRLLAASHD